MDIAARNTTDRPTPTTPDAETMETIPARHPLRWVSAAVVVVIAVSVVVSLATNDNLKWSVVGDYLFSRLVFEGLWTTLWLTVAAMIIGIVGGVMLAVMRLSANPILSGLAGLFVWVFRGTPLLVQIIFWGYLGALYPQLIFGIPFTDIVFFDKSTSTIVTGSVAALLALGLNEMAYASEIVRAGLLAVDDGQTEAAFSLGMTPAATTRRIVLPQAMRVIVPPMGNETITMLKSTALVSVISGHDLLTNLQNVYSQNFEVIPLLIVASIWYLVLTSLLSIPQAWLERRYSRGTLPLGNDGPLTRLTGLRLRRPAKKSGEQS
jgi:polar amino acid transport system permease protein